MAKVIFICVNYWQILYAGIEIQLVEHRLGETKSSSVNFKTFQDGVSKVK